MRSTGLVLAAMLGASLLPAHADSTPPSAIHGFGDASFKNDYITPRGLLVTDKGLTDQLLGGLVFVLPDNFALVVGTWNDINTDHSADAYLPNKSSVGDWNEFDYFAGFNYTQGALKLGASYVAFISPPGVFKTEQNVEFTASYDDSAKSSPFSIQPYAKFFWAVAGDSTVVLGKAGHTYDVELGAVPTLSLSGVTLTLPTWLTVGPSGYWNAQAADKGLPSKDSNIGVLSTGLTAKAPMSFIPPQYGGWYWYAGVQYYHLFNDALVNAQSLTVNSQDGHRNVVNGFAGLGFNF